MNIDDKHTLLNKHAKIRFFKFIMEAKKNRNTYPEMT